MRTKRKLSIFLAIIMLVGVFTPSVLMPAALADGGEMPFLLAAQGGLTEYDDANPDADCDYQWIIDGDAYKLVINSTKEITVTPNPSYTDTDKIPMIEIWEDGNVTVNGCEFKNGYYSYDFRSYIVVEDGSKLTLKDTTFECDNGETFIAVELRGSCDVTLDGITSSLPIICEANSDIMMTVLGVNNVNVADARVRGSSHDYYAALFIDPTARLIIDGGGTLNIRAVGASALGGKASQACTTSIANMGTLFIRDAVVNASSTVGVDGGGQIGAGIGTGTAYEDNDGIAEEIRITGGTIDAASEKLQSIGAHNIIYDFVIDGGSVKADGVASKKELDFSYTDGFENAALAGKLSHRPQNSDGDDLYMVTVDGLTPSSLVTSLTFAEYYSYGIANMYSDNAGKIYIWLPEYLSETVGTVAVGGATITFTVPELGGEDDDGGGDDEPEPDPSLTTPTLGDNVFFNRNNADDPVFTLPLCQKIIDDSGIVGYTFYCQEEDRSYSFYTDSDFKNKVDGYPAAAGEYYMMLHIEKSDWRHNAADIKLGKIIIEKKAPEFGEEFYVTPYATLPYDTDALIEYAELDTDEYEYDSMAGYLGEATLSFYSDAAYANKLTSPPSEVGVYYHKIAFEASDYFLGADIELGKFYILDEDAEAKEITMGVGENKYLYIFDDYYILSSTPENNQSIQHPKAIAFLGDYILSGSGEACIYVGEHFNQNDTERTITLSNLNLAVSNNCVFSIGQSANVNLLLEGANSLESRSSGSAWNNAGLHVNYFATLTIDVAEDAHDASLTASSTGNYAGIGNTMGTWDEEIIINGGTVIAYSEGNGDGIFGENVTINGGTVTAYSLGTGTGIRGNNVTVSGGSLIAKDSSGDNVIENAKNGDANLSLATLTLTDAPENATVTSTSIAGYGTKNVKTDENGKLYFWLPDTFNETDIFVEVDHIAYSGRIENGAATLTKQHPSGMNIELTAPEDITYGDVLGEPQAKLMGPAEENPRFTFTYGGINGTQYATSATKPMYPGEYVVVAMYSDGDATVFATAEFEIGKKQLTWRPGSVETKYYDGTTTAETARYPDLAGVINGDQVGVNILEISAEFVSADVGTGIEVVASAEYEFYSWQAARKYYILPESMEDAFEPGEIKKQVPRNNIHFEISRNQGLPLDASAIIEGINGCEGFGTATVSYYADRACTEPITSPTTAGNYYAIITLAEGSNFTAADYIFTGKIVATGESENKPPVIITEKELPFVDVAKGAWYYGAVKFVYENGLMVGVSETTFSPDAPLSRAMVAVVLWNAENNPTVTGEDRFTDLEKDWYRAAINWAADNAIVKGYGNGCYGPDDLVTREQMVAILQRYCEYKGISTPETADLSVYTDGSKVSKWAAESVRWAVGAGLITGRSETILAPGSTAKRAEFALVLQRFMDYIR